MILTFFIVNYYKLSETFNSSIILSYYIKENERLGPRQHFPLTANNISSANLAAAKVQEPFQWKDQPL